MLNWIVSIDGVDGWVIMVQEDVVVVWGRLWVLLGVVLGVGKIYVMFDEGKYLCVGGFDVVIVVVEIYGWVVIVVMIEGMEVILWYYVECCGIELLEMDFDGVLVQYFDVVFVDEFVYINVFGFCNEKCWQDVEEFLEVGIDVILMVNIQYIEFFNDVVE